MNDSHFIAIVDDRRDGPSVVWFERSRIPRKKEDLPEGMPFQRITYVPTGQLIYRVDGAQAEVYRREEDMTR